jgi:hypothetical protein
MAAIITPITSPIFFPPKYNANELNLIPSFFSKTSFNSNNCYIESFTFNLNNDLLFLTYDYTDYIILNDGQSAGNDGALSKIILDPERDLMINGLETPNGEYILLYNFFQKRIGTPGENLYISEISSDRTEIRLDSTDLNSTQLQTQAEDFIVDRDISPYFQDFYLNFGNNTLILANNILVDLDNDPTSPSVLVKLYQPLPEEFEINQPLWIVTSIEESKAYKIKFPLVPIEFEQNTDNILYPNFNLDIKDQVNNSTLSLSYTDLILTSQTSSLNQLNSLFEEKEIDINVDYTDFSNFIHFSSAQTRIENFYYKIQLIEEYSESILNLDSISISPTSESKANYESKINSIITNFDGYEYFLYYENSPQAWPKSTTQKPYQLYNSNSDQVSSWLGATDYNSPFYGGQLYSASNYDNLNKDNLFYTIPEYLREDPANDPYQLFIEMIGQHYDNIWIYYRDVAQKYSADNRLENGISKDLVADAIRDFGIKLYQNSFSNEDLYTAFLGLTPEGGLFPFPNITGSLPTPSGYEYINTKISASNDYLPLDDVNKSLYKRIYHNLPYLLQTKGTLPGLRALITSYGIPDTILRIKEYGGKDKINTNDWDYWQNEFNYAYKQNGNNFISSSFALNSLWGATSNNPETVMFRFKTNGLPTSSIPYSQSLFLTKVTGAPRSTITLRYTGSAYTSGSYSGSIIDPYYQHAFLDFHPDATGQPTLSASVYLPFFDGEWWSVMAKKTGTGASTNFELYSGNKMYEGGENGTSIGFFDSSLVIANDANYNLATQAAFGSGSITVNSKLYNSFSGSFQEIRYYSEPISESVFKDFIMNPSSIEGNSINSGANQLVFRLPLGGELYTGSKSIHPKVTGSWVTTSSFASNSTASFNSTPTFVPNTEYFYYDQPVAGIKNAIADKIRVENNVIPEGDVLSPFMSLSQQANISQSYTANTNLLEVAFSPQDEINDDINSSLGYFNIGEYIGDPRLRSSSAESYPSLNALRDSYFQKYTKNYNLVDFVRLIKFFDNSLFKMIKDFVPARTSLASGIIIKQHILERNKYPQPQIKTKTTSSYITNDIFNYKISASVYPQEFIGISYSYIPKNYGSVVGADTLEFFDNTTGKYTFYNTSNIPIIVSSSITTSGSIGLINNSFYLYNYSPSSNSTTLLSSTLLSTGANITKTLSASYNPSVGDQLFTSLATDGNLTLKSSSFLITQSVNPQSPPNIPFIPQNLLVSGTLLPQWNNYNPGNLMDFNVGTGGIFENFNGLSFSPEGINNLFNLTQSWSESISTPLGFINTIHNSQDEFYNGEFSGSSLLISTGNLYTPTVPEYREFNYTPVQFSLSQYNIDISVPNPDYTFAEEQFVSLQTKPNPGEILILTPWFQLGGMTPGGGFFPNQYGNSYVKIHKEDFNGNYNNIPLGQATRLLILYDGSTSYTPMVIQSTTEYPDYFFYQVDSIGNPNYSVDNYILDYSVSASNVTPTLLPVYPALSSPIIFNTVDGNIEGFFTGSTGYYINSQTPNITLNVSASIITSGSIPGSFLNFLGIFSISNGNATTLATTPLATGANVATTISASYYPLGTDSLFLAIIQTGDLTLKSGSFLVTQSTSPIAISDAPIIIEPYLVEANFYNSNDNAIINHISDQRPSTYALDVDYSTGIIPNNFGLLISGTATPATVPNSNYTSKKSTIIKYEGSKSTSQFLNKYTEGDEGTYGNTPTVQSLKTAIAYCPGIYGWPPEHENASTTAVQYLIKSDGSIIIPNSSPHSLSELQGNFISGENIIINSKDGLGTSELEITRKIIRGASSIEPIFYTQIGQAPTQSFATSSTFVGINDAMAQSSSNVIYPIGDYSFTATSPTYADNNIGESPTIIKFNNQTSKGTDAQIDTSSDTWKYVITQDLIDDKIDLSFSFDIKVSNTTGYQQGSQRKRRFGAILQHERDGVPLENTPYQNFLTGEDMSQFKNDNSPYANKGIIRKYSDIKAGDKFYIVGEGRNTNGSTYVESGGTFKVVQNILPGYGTGSFIDMKGFWISASNTPTQNVTLDFINKSGFSGQNIIFTTQSLLIDNFNNPSIRMVDLVTSNGTASGMNPVKEHWNIKYGDEFKFEGRENQTYLTIKAGVISVYSFSSLNIPFSHISSSLAYFGSQSLNINGITLYYTGSATLPANTSESIYIRTGSFAASTVADYVATSSAIFNFSSSIALYSASLQFISSSNSSPNLLLTYLTSSTSYFPSSPYIQTNLALTSASLNVPLTYISASLASGSIGSQSLNINGITLFYTGSATLPANTSNIIYIRTGSFTGTTVAHYVATSSAIFNFSSSIALYSASLQFISSSNSSPNLLLTSTLTDGVAGNSYYAISGSTTSSFSGGTNNKFLFPNIPVLAVEFDRPVPPSESLNLNQFLIRRYVDNASQNIIEGFRPVGSIGPYLIKPEFVVPELDKSIDEIILLLTEKGLLT